MRWKDVHRVNDVIATSFCRCSPRAPENSSNLGRSNDFSSLGIYCRLVTSGDGDVRHRLNMYISSRHFSLLSAIAQNYPNIHIVGIGLSLLSSSSSTLRDASTSSRRLSPSLRSSCSKYHSLLGVDWSVVQKLDVLLESEDGFLGRPQAVRKLHLLNARVAVVEGISHKRV